MPVTFRKLRKMFKKDGFTQESRLKEIRHPGGSDTVVKTVLNRIYNDSDKMTFEDLEAVCHVFS